MSCIVQMYSCIVLQARPSIFLQPDLMPHPGRPLCLVRAAFDPTSSPCLHLVFRPLKPWDGIDTSQISKAEIEQLTLHNPNLDIIPIEISFLLLPRGSSSPLPLPVSTQRFLTACIRPSPSFNAFKPSCALCRTVLGKAVFRATYRNARRCTSNWSADTRLRISRSSCALPPMMYAWCRGDDWLIDAEVPLLLLGHGKQIWFR